MEICVDTANLDEIREISRLGVLDGVTTNPTLIARQKRDFETTIREIDGVVDEKIWCEVIGTEADGMIREAKEMVGWARNPVIKLPMGLQGVRAASALSDQGIETNMTLVYSVPQAILAAKAGVSYVSPYVGRMDDAGSSGVGLIRDIVDVFDRQRLETKVLAASIRNPQHVAEVALAGAHAVTMPPAVLKSMAEHPMTDAALARFLKDWEDAGL